MIKDMVGKKFGRLSVLKRAENSKYGDAKWECLCDCGSTSVHLGYRLRSGKAKSCGCLHADIAKIVATKHGHSDHPLYGVWYGIMARCYNARRLSYKDYGGKGIGVCALWRDNFSAFFDWSIKNGYKQGLTIERKDNNKGYSPDNCCFASRAEQNRNTTRTHRISHNGQVLTASQVAQIVGISRGTASQWCREYGYTEYSQFENRAKKIAGR